MLVYVSSIMKNKNTINIRDEKKWNVKKEKEKNSQVLLLPGYCIG